MFEDIPGKAMQTVTTSENEDKENKESREPRRGDRRETEERGKCHSIHLAQGNQATIGSGYPYVPVLGGRNQTPLREVGPGSHNHHPSRPQNRSQTPPTYANQGCQKPPLG